MVDKSLQTQCQVCLQACKPLRCQRCKSAWYCSMICQRKDWKRHRSSCKEAVSSPGRDRDVPVIQSPNEFMSALSELSSIVTNASTKTLIQDYHLANDRIKKCQEEPLTELNTDSTQNTYKPKILVKNEDSSIPAPTHLMDKSIRDSTVMQKQNNLEGLKSSKLSEFWRVSLEEMSQICCYQILLIPARSQKLRLENFALTVMSDPYNLNKGFLSFSYHGLKLCPLPSQAMKIEIKRRLIPDSQRVYLVDQETAISIRLSYSPNDIQEHPIENMSLLTISQIQSLACKYCHNGLVRRFPGRDQNDVVNGNERKTSVIERVLPLPSGQWDEMDDFLMCYPGQPVVGFSSDSTVSQEHTVYEDETIIVAHSVDTADSVCLLATTGYGQEDDSVPRKSNGNITDSIDSSAPASSAESSSLLSLESSGLGKDQSEMLRGSRGWLESVGGATLTCSLCASVIGFAPIGMPETYRLLKHRLVLYPNDPTQRSCFPTITSFIAHEMIRYAETKAVFSFQVILESATANQRKCIFLRLLSWDTRTIRSDQFTLNDDGCIELSMWNKTAKLIYEELSESAEEIEASHGTSNVLWMLSQNDWCCPAQGPSNRFDSTEKKDPEKKDPKMDTTQSLVRFYISKQEWGELRNELKMSSKFVSKEMTEAIVLAKTGRSIRVHDGLGLALVPLRNFR